MNRAATAAIVLACVLTCAGHAPGQVDPSAENPLAPTRQQVNARFGVIQREVDRLRSSGMAAEADAMAQRLQHFRNQLAGTAPSPVPGPELNAIGTYESGRATVDVHPTDRPVVLSLSSYHHVDWTMRLYEGANIQKVIVSGYEPVNRPANLPEGVPVELYSSASQSGLSFYPHRKEFTSTYAGAARTLKTLTGLPISSFQGNYNVDGATFSVGSGSDEWAAQRVLTDMIPLYKEAVAFERNRLRAAAEPYRFVAITQTFDATGLPTGRRIAQLSPAGPIDGTTLPARTSSFHVAVDPRDSTYYTMPRGGRPVVFDPMTGASAPLPAVDLSHLTGLTFDTRRNRLVVSTLGGGGFLYTYSPDQDQWSTLTSLNGVSMYSTTYSAADDTLYALTGSSQIAKYDPEGRRIGTINLSEAIIPAELWTSQLTATGDRLSLITPAVPDLYEPHLTPMERSYVIDPDTGAVTFLGVIPEPGAMTLIACLFGGAMLGRRRREWP